MVGFYSYFCGSVLCRGLDQNNALKKADDVKAALAERQRLASSGQDTTKVGNSVSLLLNSLARLLHKYEKCSTNWLFLSRNLRIFWERRVNLCTHLPC
jgi:hypothetical protein